MKLKRLYKKIYYKYFAPIQYHTVVLRGALTSEQKEYVQAHASYDSEVKKIFDADHTEKKFLEIGFGNGSHMKYLGENFRGSNFSIYGLELDWVSVVRLLNIIDSSKIENAKVIREDARTFLNKVPKKYFDTIFVLYSDPWTRKRDLKRRLVNKDFVIKCLGKIKEEGQMILATDIESYQEQIEGILNELKNENIVNFQSAFEGDENILETKFNFNLTEIFKTKFALRAKREGRRNKLYLISVI